MPISPSPSFVAVSKLGDVLLNQPTERSAVLFVSRFCLPRYLNTGAPECSVPIQGLGAEAIHSWFAAGLPFTFACQCLDPLVLTLRLNTGFAVAITDTMDAVSDERLAGVDLIISRTETRMPSTATTHFHNPAWMRAHGSCPDADAIENCVRLMSHLNHRGRNRC